MSRAGSKDSLALTLAEDLLNDLDSDNVKTSTALRRLKRIANLVSDDPVVEWTTYELTGYPVRVASRDEAREAIASHAQDESFKRRFDLRIDGEIDDRLLEKLVDLIYEPLPPYRRPHLSPASTLSYSSGKVVPLGDAISRYEETLEQMRRKKDTRFTYSHSGTTFRWSSSDLNRLIDGARFRVYDATIRLHEELLFGQIPSAAIERTFRFVDSELYSLVPDAADRLTTAYQNLADRNEENWVNVADTCRRVIKDIADRLYPARDDSAYGMRVTDEKYLNRIRAYIRDNISSRRVEQQLDEVLKVLAELISRTDNLASRSVHQGSITRYSAERILLYTYLAIGDMLVLTGLASRPDAEDERLSLRSATVGELTDRLGLPVKVAQQLVAHRRQHPFRTWQDVQEVKGIGPKRLETLKQQASL